MDIEVITTFRNMTKYYKQLNEGDINLVEFWEYITETIWEIMSKMEILSEESKKDKMMIRDCLLGKDLKLFCEQIPLLSRINIEYLQSEFEKITNLLPFPYLKKMLVVISPSLCNWKERSDPYISKGVALFHDVIILKIDPFIDNWQEIIFSVFAHEYHHNIWTYNKCILNNECEVNELTLLDILIMEGEAILFEKSLFPDLVKPLKREPFDIKTEKKLWEKIKLVLLNKEGNIIYQYLKGDGSKDFPYAMGYQFGEKMVKSYMNKNPSMSFLELFNITTKEIFESNEF